MPESDWQNQCSGTTYAGDVDPYTTRVQDARAAFAYLDGDSRISVVFYPGCGSDLGFGSPSSSYWRPNHDFRMNLAELDPLRANCETRASTAINTYGATSGSGRQVLRITYVDANHGFDGESQTWPSSSSCATGASADVCAMNAADINSWIFFRDRM